MSGTVQIGTLEAVLKLKDEFKGPIDDARKSINNFASDHKASMTAVGQAAGIALAAATAVAGAIVYLGQRGAAVADVSDQFEILTRRTGETADVMLGALKRGVGGTISDFELMKMANASMGAGLKATSGDFDTLAAGAKLLADRTGGDTSQAFEQLTSAMASGRTAALKQLGVFVDSKEAIEKYAAAHKMAAGDMNDAQRAAALQAETLNVLRGQLTEAGAASLDFGDRLDRGKTILQNFVDGLGMAIANSPVLATAMDSLSGAIEGAFGENSQQLIDTVSDLVGEIAITLISSAQIGVEAARFLSNAWAGLKVLFASVMVVLVGGLEMANKGIALLFEAASKPPVVGDKFKGMAAEAREAGTFLEGMRKDFQAQVGEAIDGAGRQSAALDKVKAVLGDTKAAMIAAQEEARNHTAATDDQKTATEELTGAVQAYTGATDTASVSTASLRKSQEEASKAAEEARKRMIEVNQAFFEQQVADDEAYMLRQRTNAAEEVRLWTEAWQLELAERQKNAAAQAELDAQYQRLMSDTRNAEGLAQMEAERQRLEKLKVDWMGHVNQMTEGFKALATIGGEHMSVLATSTGTVTAAIKAATAARSTLHDGFKSLTSGQGLSSILGGISGIVGGIGGIVGAAQAAVSAIRAVWNAFRSEESRVVNKPRDQFLDQFGGWDATAKRINDARDGNVAEALMRQLGDADTEAKFKAAERAIVDVIGGNVFAKGTPNLGFQNFGSGQLAMLHKKEAVVPENRKQDAAMQWGAAELHERLDRMELAIVNMPSATGRAIRDNLQLAQ